jgi:hypothetical protein
VLGLPPPQVQRLARERAADARSRIAAGFKSSLRSTAPLPPTPPAASPDRPGEHSATRLRAWFPPC